MFRPLLLLVIFVNFISGLTLNVMACDWDLDPNVLLLTSYNAAQNEESTDQLVYKQLKNIYGSRAVSAIFSVQDDNSYAIILRNFIENYHLKKVFILDPSFVNYLPSSSKGDVKSSNLIRIMQQFTNVKFYFFNNQIANNIKISSNIFEFRLDTANKEFPKPKDYGTQIAEYFYKKLIKNDGTIDTDKYKFDVDKDGKWLIKIGIINNIGNQYQQNILNTFKENLDSNPNFTPKNTRYSFFNIDVTNPAVNYNQKTVNLVTKAATNLYFYNKVNFIINTNSWYNNSIAYAATYVNSVIPTSKTISFIFNSVTDNQTFFSKDQEYLLFAFDVDWTFLNYTKDGEKIPDDWKLLPEHSEERDNAYGINQPLIFVDGF